MPEAALFDFEEAGLVPDPDNLNEHNEKNLKAIADSVEETGFLRSIAIDENNVIRAGNGTAEIAKQRNANILIVDVDDPNTLVAVRRKGLTDLEKTRAGLWDNETARLAKRKNSAIQRVVKANPGQMIMEGIISDKDQSKIMREHENAQPLAVGGTDEEPELATGKIKERQSDVRMVQLILTVDNQPVFVSRMRALGKLFEAKNITDGVFAVVEKAYNEWIEEQPSANIPAEPDEVIAPDADNTVTQ